MSTKPPASTWPARAMAPVAEDKDVVDKAAVAEDKTVVDTAAVAEDRTVVDKTVVGRRSAAKVVRGRRA
jgi:hypothetical protein